MEGTCWLWDYLVQFRGNYVYHLLQYYENLHFALDSFTFYVLFLSKTDYFSRIINRLCFIKEKERVLCEMRNEEV